MIIRNEDGRAVFAENISDITKEIRSLEATISEAVENRKKGSPLNDEERAQLNLKVEDLKTVISNLDDDTKKKAGAVELISFVKELTKFKKFVDDLKKLADNG